MCIFVSNSTELCFPLFTFEWHSFQVVIPEVQRMMMDLPKESTFLFSLWIWMQYTVNVDPFSWNCFCPVYFC